MVSSKKTVKPCPKCKKEVPPRSEAKAFPFCSSRCQLADLGSWLDDSYTVPGEPHFD